MESKQVLRKLRKQHHLTQDEMAEKFFVTRQAVSRWESGKTVPSVETLQLISKEFSVPINALLGAPLELWCQACGMPLKEDDSIAREPDGSFNESYCRWCHVEGKYVGPGTVEEMIEICVPHMGWPNPDEARAFLAKQLPQLAHWRKD